MTGIGWLVTGVLLVGFGLLAMIVSLRIRLDQQAADIVETRISMRALEARIMRWHDEEHGR